MASPLALAVTLAMAMALARVEIAATATHRSLLFWHRRLAVTWVKQLRKSYAAATVKCSTPTTNTYISMPHYSSDLFGMVQPLLV